MTPRDIRERILEVVGRTGGHLAASLGAVEIALALSRVFDPQKDRIVWDVGHQAYAWKILTGRNDRFDTLRQFGGVSGFPNPKESPADAAVAGHAGMALSVALGLAAARDRKGSGEHVVAVIGDAAMANGVSFEALNNCAAATGKVIVVLNDNAMSISKPIGSFAGFLGRLITGVRYNRVKMAAEAAGHKLKLTFLRNLYHELESRIKGLFLGSRYFEQFGLRYIGPIDGHDLKAVEDALTVAKEDKRSVIVHVVTKKGKGFPQAEREPTKFHGVGPFATAAKPSAGKSWSQAFGDAVAELARRDKRIVALTAAMKDGTGLDGFASEFPARFFDVGIAEEHLLGFAAGLAAGGMRPVVAIYSTFLQRAIDQVFHDMAIAGLPVIIGIDRAGVVGADGVTHQGLYDLALLRAFPNVTIAQPKDEEELKIVLSEALERGGVTAVRYPRGECPAKVELADCGNKVAIWCTGDWAEKANRVAAKVGGKVISPRYLKPVDLGLVERQRREGMLVAAIENAAAIGGLGDAIGADLKFGWPDEFIPHGKVPELEKAYGLDETTITERILAYG